MRKVVKGIFIGLGIAVGITLIDELRWNYKISKSIRKAGEDDVYSPGCGTWCPYVDECGDHVFVNWDEAVERYGKDVMEFIESKGIEAGLSMEDELPCMEIISYTQTTGVIFVRLVPYDEYAIITFDAGRDIYVANKVEV